MIATEIIAHRGLSSLCPENTLIAMRGAAKIGAVWVEADVQVLKDGTPIIMHDHDLARTTDSKGLLNECTIRDVAGVDAGGWFDEKFEGERIPLLKDLLELTDELNLGLNLEVKYHEDHHAELSDEEREKIIDSIMRSIQHAPRPPRGFLISSLSYAFLKDMREKNSKLQLGWIYDNKESISIPRAKEIGVVSLHLRKDILLEDIGAGKKLVEQIKEESLEIYVYTVNDVPEVKSLFEMGVDGIFTDYPQNFKRYLP